MAPDATLKDLFLNGLVHLFPLTLPDQTLAFYTAGRNKRVTKKFTNAQHIFLWEVFCQLPLYLLKYCSLCIYAHCLIVVVTLLDIGI
jgi:hypothetical protein